MGAGGRRYTLEDKFSKIIDFSIECFPNSLIWRDHSWAQHCSSGCSVAGFKPWALIFPLETITLGWICLIWHINCFYFSCHWKSYSLWVTDSHQRLPARPAMLFISILGLSSETFLSCIFGTDMTRIKTDQILTWEAIKKGVWGGRGVENPRGGSAPKIKKSTIRNVDKRWARFSVFSQIKMSESWLKREGYWWDIDNISYIYGWFMFEIALTYQLDCLHFHLFSIQGEGHHISVFPQFQNVHISMGRGGQGNFGLFLLFGLFISWAERKLVPL